jgi:hypothetical protein
MSPIVGVDVGGLGNAPRLRLWSPFRVAIFLGSSALVAGCFSGGGGGGSASVAADPCADATNSKVPANSALSTVYTVDVDQSGTAVKITNIGLDTLLVTAANTVTSLTATGDPLDPAVVLARSAVVSQVIVGEDTAMPQGGGFYLVPRQSVCGTTSSAAQPATVWVRPDVTASVAYYIAHSVSTKLVDKFSSDDEKAIAAVTTCAQYGLTLYGNQADGYTLLANVLNAGSSCYAVLEALDPDDFPGFLDAAKAAGEGAHDLALDALRALEDAVEKFHG